MENNEISINASETPEETPVTEAPSAANEAPINQPINNQPAPAKKPKTGLIITFVVLIVILIGAITAVMIITNNNNSSNNGGNGSNNSNNSGKVEETETPITEGAEVTAMNNNLHILFNRKLDNKPLDLAIIQLNHTKEVVNDTLTKDGKLDAILRYLTLKEDAFTKVKESDYTNEDLSKYYGLLKTREDFFEYTKEISAEKVEELYEKVFGEKPEHKDQKEICGGFLYNPTRKVYYNGPLNACGGIPSVGYFFKHVGYSKKGTKYYADYKISHHLVESKSSKNDGTNDTGVSKYYAGRDNSFELIKSYEKEMDYSFDSTCALSDSDWEKVATYRFTFEKEGDTLKYTGIEEL